MHMQNHAVVSATTVARNKARPCKQWLLAAALAALLPSGAKAATPTLKDVDIGTYNSNDSTLTGSMTTTKDAAGNPVYLIRGGGDDIWNAADSFHYAYFKVSGDFDYVVRVQDVEGPDTWTKAELMAREPDSTGNPTQADRFVAQMTTRDSTAGTAGQNNVNIQLRVQDRGDNAAGNPGGAQAPSDVGLNNYTTAPTYPNTWLRLRRAGNVFQNFVSTDGKNWTLQTTIDTSVGFGSNVSPPPGGPFAKDLLLGLAVTAHNNTQAAVQTGTFIGGEAIFSDLAPYNEVPAAIVTQPPAAVSVAANDSLALSVAATGDPVAYQWYKDNNIITNATSATYNVPLVQSTDAGSYTVVVTGNASPITSSKSVVTVTPDTKAPSVADVSADGTFTLVNVTFSEPVSDSALTKANYSIDGGVTISSVARASSSKVQLTTSTMADTSSFNLKVSNVQDTAGNTIAANTTVPFKSFAFTTGYAYHKFWNTDANVTSLATMYTNPNYPNNPSWTGILSAWEYPPANGPYVAPALNNNEAGDNYSNQISGYFIPPQNGNYVFFANSDDQSDLYLSTDGTPANKKLIAQEQGWSNPLQWVTTGSGDVTSKRSDQFTGTEWPGGNTITLKAGQKYYIEQNHWEGGGGDNVDATFIIEGANDPANGTATALTGSVIGTYLNPNGASVNITQQPANDSILQNQNTTLSIAATGTSAYGGNVSYQWQSAPKGSSNFTPIAGATGPTYKTPTLALSDDGIQYRVVASVPAASSTSSVAVVSVGKDTNPPIVTVGAVPSSTAGTADVGVGFSKPVDDSTASVAANYTVTGGTLSKFTYYPRSQSALLKITGVTSGASVTVKNVADSLGNKITSTTVPFTVSTSQAWGVVGADELNLGNWVVPVSATGFDVYSDSIGEWNNYDEATFVYEKITGDFDKKVRVEYQDQSSQWARAGLVVRDVSNFGVDRNAQVGSNSTTPPFDGKAGKYQKVHVNPVGPTLTGPGTAGNAAWEGNRRLAEGANCTSALWENGATPQYPNAWCRLQRVGPLFTIYRSDDGVNWLVLGRTIFDETMPDTVLVGPEYAPENGNITNASDQSVFVAKFRDYGDVVSAVQPTLTYQRTANGLVLTFTGTLQSSDKVTGPWTDVPGASPQIVPMVQHGNVFFQTRQ
jgi:hypothetical protein